MNYTTVIFDLDGTLTDTLDDLTNGVNYALSRFDFPKRSRDEIRSFVGNGVKRLINLSVPDGTDEETAARVLKAFREYYPLHSMEKTKPYDGITELVSLLKNKGVKIGVVSNKTEDAVIKIVDYYFGNIFDSVSGQVDGRPQKPAPDGVLHTMDELSADKTKTIYVGDSDVDCMTAHNASIPVIGVSWGFRDRSVLEANGADFIAENPSDIARIVSGEENI